jgi:hypothetical protein
MPRKASYQSIECQKVEPNHEQPIPRRLPRDIGTQDDLKRATERPAGKTRAHKSDEEQGQSE